MAKSKRKSRSTYTEVKDRVQFSLGDDWEQFILEELY